MFIVQIKKNWDQPSVNRVSKKTDLLQDLERIYDEKEQKNASIEDSLLDDKAIEAQLDGCLGRAPGGGTRGEPTNCAPQSLYGVSCRTLESTSTNQPVASTNCALLS